MFRFDHAQKPYIEFPIMADGQPFDGESSPGADRVVNLRLRSHMSQKASVANMRSQILGSIATDFQSAVYCAVVTHDGQRKNGFVECKDDTVNQNGSGNFDVSKTFGRGVEPDSGRKLLDTLYLK